MIARSGLLQYPEIAAEVLHQQSPWVDQELVEIFEAARCQDADDIFSRFDSELQRLITYERTHGRLKPVTVADGMKQFADQFARHVWNLFEREGVATLMKDGQRISSVDFHTVKLRDGATITRRDLREKLRTGADLSPRYWDARFTSERTIAQAEEAARDSQARSERPFRYGSGPMTDDGRPLTR